jgi:hypothetical protein
MRMQLDEAAKQVAEAGNGVPKEAPRDGIVFHPADAPIQSGSGRFPSTLLLLHTNMWGGIQ